MGILNISYYIFIIKYTTRPYIYTKVFYAVFSLFTSYYYDSVFNYNCFAPVVLRM